MIFSLDGAFMEIWLIPYAARIHIVFVLTSGRRYITLIAIDVFFLKTTSLGSKEMLLERILLWERDLWGLKPVKRYGKGHNWTHKCGLWELPYSKALILVHNIDIMHQEHNVVESIVMTCMDFLDKTKDNKKSEKRLGYDLAPIISWTIWKWS
jgi:hypothetical protein